jgi:hypothetical protein
MRRHDGFALDNEFALFLDTDDFEVMTIRF